MGVPWFRFYTEVLNDPKILRLTDKEFRTWVLTLCVAAENDGKICTDDLAIQLRMPEAKTSQLFDSLVVRGLLHETEDGCAEPHNWKVRQYKSDVSTVRVKRFRERHETVSETPPDTEAEQKQIRTETDPEEEAPKRRNIFVLYDNFMGKPALTQQVRELLIDAESAYPSQCIEHCFKEAASSSDGRRSWSYVKAILDRHQRDGCDDKSRLQTVGRAARPVDDDSRWNFGSRLTAN
jgi:hypothetical protein